MTCADSVEQVFIHIVQLGNFLCFWVKLINVDYFTIATFWAFRSL